MPLEMPLAMLQSYDFSLGTRTTAATIPKENHLNMFQWSDLLLMSLASAACSHVFPWGALRQCVSLTHSLLLCMAPSGPAVESPMMMATTQLALSPRDGRRWG